MKILLFGGSGQLGHEIREKASNLNFQVVSPISSEVNITNQQQVDFLVTQLNPDIIINSAAYTAVDDAEVNTVECFATNSLGSKNVALAAKKNNTRLVYISTDYVFSGKNIDNSPRTIPYLEEDMVNPLSVYGASKNEGEQHVVNICGQEGLIVRTSSLYGKKSPNFVHTVLRLFTEGREVSVVNDQFMLPTWSGWLAEVILDLVRIPKETAHGIVHVSCGGDYVSWYDFASRIHELTKNNIDGAIASKVVPVLASNFGRPAPRPNFSVLNCSKLSSWLNRPCLNWDLALQYCLREINVL
jgi:dTDP-4-dehydrorhamnose reductase